MNPNPRHLPSPITIVLALLALIAGSASCGSSSSGNGRDDLVRSTFAALGHGDADALMKSGDIDVTTMLECDHLPDPVKEARGVEDMRQEFKRAALRERGARFEIVEIREDATPEVKRKGSPAFPGCVLKADVIGGGTRPGLPGGTRPGLPNVHLVRRPDSRPGRWPGSRTRRTNNRGLSAGKGLAPSHGVVSLPRQILPDCIYMVNRRCTQRQFLLRPDPEVNNAFLYNLAVGAARYQIDVLLPSVMSNHHHTLVHDPHGNVCDLMQHLHGFVARSVNALRGRWENLWSSEPACLVRLVDRDDVIRKLVYAATNPVKDHLVARVADWPGVNGLASLLADRPLVARRPTHYFREDGDLPEEVELRLVLPPSLGDPDAVREEIRQHVADVERACDIERSRSGQRVMGRAAILRQRWRDRPKSREPRRGLRPRIAAHNYWARQEAIHRNRAFLSAYRYAWVAWKTDRTVVFPPGTFALRRFANVTVAAIPRVFANA